MESKVIVITAASDGIGAAAAKRLSADGHRVAFREFNEAWAAKFDACLRAAEEAGELAEDGQRRDLRAWFVHHLALGLMLYLNPKVPATNYQASGKTLVEEAAQFALRGAGLKEEAIKRHYKPRAPGRPNTSGALPFAHTFNAGRSIPDSQGIGDEFFANEGSKTT